MRQFALAGPRQPVASFGPLFPIAATLLAPLFFATPAAPQIFPTPPPPPCDEWGTGYFFRSASPERVRECLAADADPGTPNPDGVTPLHLAAHQNDNPDIVTILVEAGADPNARGPSGLTPLHMSWSRPRSTRAVAVVRELLRLGADPLAVDDRGWVADPTHCDHWNTGAFSRFAVRADFASCLAEGADVFARDENFPYWNDGGYTVLHHATANEDPSIIALLVEAGADLEARNDRRGFTPLHLAIGNGNLAAVTALLDAGANIEADAGGIWGTPLISAAQRISGIPGERNTAMIATIDALLAAGADVNAVDEDGDSPLLNVLWGGRIGLFRTTGPEPDAAADAHAQAIVDLVFRLLEAGADPRRAWGLGTDAVARSRGIQDLGAGPGPPGRRGRSRFTRRIRRLAPAPGRQNRHSRDHYASGQCRRGPERPNRSRHIPPSHCSHVDPLRPHRGQLTGADRTVAAPGNRSPGGRRGSQPPGCRGRHPPAPGGAGVRHGPGVPAGRRRRRPERPQRKGRDTAPDGPQPRQRTGRPQAARSWSRRQCAGRHGWYRRPALRPGRTPPFCFAPRPKA